MPFSAVYRHSQEEGEVTSQKEVQHIHSRPHCSICPALQRQDRIFRHGSHFILHALWCPSKEGGSIYDC